MWVDKDREIYNRSIKSWLQDKYTEIYSRHNEGESVIAERFIRILNKKIYKYQKMCIDELADIVKEYNNTYNKTIKMKSSGLKSSTYVDIGTENNEKDPKFKFGDHVRISKYKYISQKVALKIGLKRFL